MLRKQVITGFIFSIVILLLSIIANYYVNDGGDIIMNSASVILIIMMIASIISLIAFSFIIFWSCGVLFFLSAAGNWKGLKKYGTPLELLLWKEVRERLEKQGE
jgi:hypothetical protein